MLDYSNQSLKWRSFQIVSLNLSFHIALPKVNSTKLYITETNNLETQQKPGLKRPDRKEIAAQLPEKKEMPNLASKQLLNLASVIRITSI